MASGGGGDGTGAGEPGIVDKKDFRELSETPKLLPKPTRLVKEREDVQRQLLSMMQEEDDYLDLICQSMAKRIKDNLTPDQRDDLVDEMFLLQQQQSQLPQATTWEWGGWGTVCLQ